MPSDFEDRITAAMQAADEAYWGAIADAFPECKSGDVSPEWVERHDSVVHAQLYQLVRSWVDGNLPHVDGLEDDPEMRLKLTQTADEQGITVAQLMERLEEFRPAAQALAASPEVGHLRQEAMRRLGLGEDCEHEQTGTVGAGSERRRYCAECGQWLPEGRA